MNETILFADTEGDDFVDNINRLWSIQIAEGVDGEVTVYADHPGYPPIKEGIERLKKADKVAFHNAFGFDFFAINKLYPGTLRREQIIDTLIISRLMDSTSMRHSLRDLGEALGFRKFHHDDFSSIYIFQTVRRRGFASSLPGYHGVTLFQPGSPTVAPPLLFSWFVSPEGTYRWQFWAVGL